MHKNKFWLIISFLLLLNIISLVAIRSISLRKLNNTKRISESIYRQKIDEEFEIYKNRELLSTLDSNIRNESIILVFSESDCSSCVYDLVCDLSILADIIGESNIFLKGVYQDKKIFDNVVTNYCSQNDFNVQFVSKPDIALSSPYIILVNEQGSKVISLSYEEYKKNRNYFKKMVKYVCNEKI
jgi:hypothetical protein